MKTKFKEYFEPEEATIEEIWRNGTIVVDANVLLNLFRYSKNSREDLMTILNFYKERLWIPYQVAFEFLENSMSVPTSLSNSLSETLKSIDKISNEIENLLKLNNYDKYHLLKPEELRKDIKKFQERLHEKVEKIKREYESIDKTDIVKQIVNIFEGKVGEDYSKEELEGIFKEGEKRYKDNIPPGYKDLEDKKGAPKRHLYGDLIWWKQAMDYSKDNDRNLIIVTDDSKDDWWQKAGGKTIGPRVELIREFANQTNHHVFHMYRTGRFMELSKKYDKVSISKTTINEVKETTSFNYPHLLGSINMPPNIGKLWDVSHLHSYDDKKYQYGEHDYLNLINPWKPKQSPYSGSVYPQIEIPSEESAYDDFLRKYGLKDMSENKSVKSKQEEGHH